MGPALPVLLSWWRTLESNILNSHLVFQPQLPLGNYNATCRGRWVKGVGGWRDSLSVKVAWHGLHSMETIHSGDDM